MLIPGELVGTPAGVALVMRMEGNEWEMVPVEAIADEWKKELERTDSDD